MNHLNESAGISAFRQLEAALETVAPAEQQIMVDSFLERYPHSPLIEADTALFLYPATPDIQALFVVGDMNDWEPTIELAQLGTTQLWYALQTFPADARLDYVFQRADGTQVLDRRNPYQIPSGMGLRSELRMSAFQVPQEIIPRPEVPKGELETLGIFYSEISNSTHELVIYLPPGYDENRRYPSVYFQDGGDYCEFAHTPTILDNAIADGILPPLIGVFVTPSQEYGRVHDYDLNADYSEFFAVDLVDVIDSQYATITNPAQRVIVGDSFGGLMSLYIALLNPQVFGGVVNHSGFVSRNGNQLITMFSERYVHDLRIDNVIGTYERKIGGRLFEQDGDFLLGNRAFRDVLQANGYTYRYNEYPQGHSWGLWRDHIDENIAWVLNWRKQR